MLHIISIKSSPSNQLTSFVLFFFFEYLVNYYFNVFYAYYFKFTTLIIIMMYKNFNNENKRIAYIEFSPNHGMKIIEDWYGYFCSFNKRHYTNKLFDRILCHSKNKLSDQLIYCLISSSIFIWSYRTCILMHWCMDGWQNETILCQFIAYDTIDSLVTYLWRQTILYNCVRFMINNQY